MWGRDSAGFPPSPDPAAEAEEHFYRLSLHEPPEPPDVCPDCRDLGWFVGREPEADCENCHGEGVFFGHAETCVSEECVLNGDLFSCDGEVQPCACTTVNCEPCSVREAEAEVAHQKTFTLADGDEETPF